MTYTGDLDLAHADYYHPVRSAIRSTNGTPQEQHALRGLADQAQADSASEVGDRAAFLDGVEAALRWAAGDGNTDELDTLIARVR